MSPAGAAIIKQNRPRGFYIPTHEASAHIANGWTLLDDCPPGPGAPARDEVLLLPPRRGEAV